MGLLRVLSLAVALLAGVFSAAAESSPDSLPDTTSGISASADAAAFPESAPVHLEGREIFRVQGAIKGYTPEMRSRAISERILRLARSPLAHVDSIRLVDTDISTDVVLGDLHLFSVFDQDALAAGRERTALASDYAKAVRAAIEEYRTARSAKRIAWGLMWTVVATVILALTLALLGRGLRGVLAAIERWIALREEGIRKRSKELLAPARLKSALGGLARAARLLLVLVAVYAYVHIVLGLFPWTHRFAATLFDLVIGPLHSMGVAFLKSLPGLAFITVLYFVMRAVLKFASFFFDEIGAGRITIQGFYPEWAKPTFNIVRILAIVFAVVVAYPHIPGSSTDAFKGVSIFIGVLVSLGSTSAVANLVAGIILTYMRAFRVGDLIEVGNQRGMVTEMAILATHMRTPKNVEITIPNATVLSSHMTNYSTHSKDRGLILNTSVGIGYDVPWRQVHAMLLSAARQTRDVLETPAPFVLQRELEGMCVRYELNAYCDKPDRMLQIYSELHRRVLDVFNEHGVQIMTPSYEADRPEPAVVPKERWYASPAKKPGEPGADE